MKNVIRIAIGVIIIGVGGYIFLNNQSETGLRNEYNTIITTQMDAENYREAIKQLVPLHGKGSDELNTKIEKDVALCYFKLAQDPSLNGNKTKEYLKKAFTIDPMLYDAHKQDYPTIDTDKDITIWPDYAGIVE